MKACKLYFYKKRICFIQIKMVQRKVNTHLINLNKTVYIFYINNYLKKNFLLK